MFGDLIKQVFKNQQHEPSPHTFQPQFDIQAYHKTGRLPQAQPAARASSRGHFDLRSNTSNRRAQLNNKLSSKIRGTCLQQELNRPRSQSSMRSDPKKRLRMSTGGGGGGTMASFEKRDSARFTTFRAPSVNPAKKRNRSADKEKENKEYPSELASKWLNLCNFTNLQQKLQYIQNDPNWGPTYSSLNLDPQLLESYQLPKSQLERNIFTYMQMLMLITREATPQDGRVISAVETYCHEVLLKLSDMKSSVMQANQSSSLRLMDADLYSHHPGLRNVLLAYSKYDATIKFYTIPDQNESSLPPLEQAARGMGCLVMAILYHCKDDEVSTFWILVSLIENYDMRQFFQQGMPGITLYGEVLEQLSEMFVPQVQQALNSLEISYVDFFLEWAKTLWSTQIPLDQYEEFLTTFLKHGWSYFFRFSLTVLACMQQEILTISSKPKTSNRAKRAEIVALLRFVQFVPPEEQEDWSGAMENFKNLNETTSYMGENFDDADDDCSRQFDNHLQLVGKQRPPGDFGLKNTQKPVQILRPPSDHDDEFSDIDEGGSSQGGFFSRFKRIIGLGPNSEDREQKARVKKQNKISHMVAAPRPFQAHHFLHEKEETWAYLLELANYLWLEHPTDAVVPELQSCLEYKIDKSLVQSVQAQRYNIALRRYVEEQRKQQNNERDEMMKRMRMYSPRQEDPMSAMSPKFNQQQEHPQQQHFLQQTHQQQTHQQQLHQQPVQSPQPFQDPEQDQQICIGPPRPDPNAALQNQYGQMNQQQQRQPFAYEQQQQQKPNHPSQQNQGENQEHPGQSQDPFHQQQQQNKLLTTTNMHSIVQFDALDDQSKVFLKNQHQRLQSFIAGLPQGARGSQVSGIGHQSIISGGGAGGGGLGGAQSASIMGLSMNLDFHPKYFLDKSNLGGQALHQVFNDGDISMMDEMNKLVSGMQGLKRPSNKSGYSGLTPTKARDSANTYELVDQINNENMSPQQRNTIPYSQTQNTLNVQQQPLQTRGSTGLSTGLNALRGSMGGHSILTRDKPQDNNSNFLQSFHGSIMPHKGQSIVVGGEFENISKIELPGKENENFLDQDQSLQKCLNMYQNRGSHKTQFSNDPEPPLQKVEEEASFQNQGEDHPEDAPNPEAQVPQREISPVPMKVFHTPNNPSSGANDIAFGSAGISPDSPNKHDMFTAPGEFKEVSQITTGERKNIQNMMFDPQEQQQQVQAALPIQATTHVQPARDKTEERKMPQVKSPPLVPQTPIFCQKVETPKPANDDRDVTPLQSMPMRRGARPQQPPTASYPSFQQQSESRSNKHGVQMMGLNSSKSKYFSNNDSLQSNQMNTRPSVKQGENLQSMMQPPTPESSRRQQPGGAQTRLITNGFSSNQNSMLQASAFASQQSITPMKLLNLVNNSKDSGSRRKPPVRQATQKYDPGQIRQSWKDFGRAKANSRQSFRPGENPFSEKYSTFLPPDLQSPTEGKSRPELKIAQTVTAMEVQPEPRGSVAQPVVTEMEVQPRASVAQSESLQSLLKPSTLSTGEQLDFGKLHKPWLTSQSSHQSGVPEAQAPVIPQLQQTQSHQVEAQAHQQFPQILQEQPWLGKAASQQQPWMAQANSLPAHAQFLEQQQFVVPHSLPPQQQQHQQQHQLQQLSREEAELQSPAGTSSMGRESLKFEAAQQNASLTQKQQAIRDKIKKITDMKKTKMARLSVTGATGVSSKQVDTTSGDGQDNQSEEEDSQQFPSKQEADKKQTDYESKQEQPRRSHSAPRESERLGMMQF